MVHKTKEMLRIDPEFYKKVGFYLGQGFSEEEAVKKVEEEMLSD